MKLAKPCLDVALFTNRRDEMLIFWQKEAGLPYEELLKTGRGNHQHRHAMNGSVFKLNHRREPLPDTPPTGYRALWIARPGLDAARDRVDPDGNHVTLVPPGTQGVTGIGVQVAARNPDAHARFYREALELDEVTERVFRCGDSLLFLEPDENATDDASIEGRGFRYLTIQVFDCFAEHARILEHGGTEGTPPARHGDVAIFSMVRDPDGNWIEISQRASLTGPLA